MSAYTLKHPINFVVPSERIWPEIVDGEIGDIDDEFLSQKCVGALANWIIIPYIYFKRRGLDVQLSPSFALGKINITSGLDMSIRSRPSQPFIVGCRADGHPPKLANFVFEQNGRNAGQRNVAWLHHPPQPNLIPRTLSRGSKIEVVAFKGAVQNLDEAFRDEAFRAALADLGMRLSISARTPAAGERLTMHDYSGEDVTLAIRNITVEGSKNKPASKLINAWRAGVPALLGPELAFAELRRSALDYIEVRSPNDVIAALIRLKSQPDLYRAMVENGFERGRNYSEQTLVEAWVAQLNGPVAEAFTRWQALPASFRTMRHIVSIPRQRWAQRKAKWHRFNGPRILD